jgi:hypothetical protein
LFQKRFVSVLSFCSPLSAASLRRPHAASVAAANDRIAIAAFHASQSRRLVQEHFNAALMAARAPNVQLGRNPAHLQIIKDLRLVDQDFELLPVPCFST